MSLGIATLHCVDDYNYKRTKEWAPIEIFKLGISFSSPP